MFVKFDTVLYKLQFSHKLVFRATQALGSSINCLRFCYSETDSLVNLLIVVKANFVAKKSCQEEGRVEK